MKRVQYSILVTTIIPLLAFVLFAVGCGGSSGGSDAAPQGQVFSNNDGTTGPIDVDNLRECTNDEFARLRNWSLILLNADNMIINQFGDDINVWTKRSDIVKAATDAVKQCDAMIFYHQLKPCKKAIKNIVATTVKGYDAYTISRRCNRVTTYLEKFKLRPNARTGGQDANSDRDDNQVQSPSEPAQTQPKAPSVDNSNLRECSSDEFARLNQYKNSLNQSNKAITALGASTNWKYNSQAITAATTTTRSCESLIQSFQNSGCKKAVKDSKSNTVIKTYTSQDLKQECDLSRQYYYEFTQRDQDLIMPSADLLLDTKIFSNTTFDVGYAAPSLELCVATNMSKSPIQYKGGKTLVTEARVYPSGTQNTQMFVLQTREGLKLECYGLNYQGASTSLNEVRRLLKAKGLSLDLSYSLK